MKVGYIKENHKQIDLIQGKVHEVMAIEKGWYRLIDESEEDYLYPPRLFEVVEEKK